eukprot:6204342-Pleurochrysis_carterae.AAC.5
MRPRAVVRQRILLGVRLWQEWVAVGREAANVEAVEPRLARWGRLQRALVVEEHLHRAGVVGGFLGVRAALHHAEDLYDVVDAQLCLALVRVVHFEQAAHPRRASLPDELPRRLLALRRRLCVRAGRAHEGGCVRSGPLGPAFHSAALRLAPQRLPVIIWIGHRADQSLHRPCGQSRYWNAHHGCALPCAIIVRHKGSAVRQVEHIAVFPGALSNLAAGHMLLINASIKLCVTHVLDHTDKADKATLCNIVDAADIQRWDRGTKVRFVTKA